MMLVKLRNAFWLFGLALFLFVIFLPGYTKLQDLREKNKDLEKKIRQLFIQNKLLEQQLQRVKNDAVCQEGIVREKMGVVRKGEVPVKIIPRKE